MVRELIRLEGVHRAFGAVSVLDGINLRVDEGIELWSATMAQENHTPTHNSDRNRMLETSLLRSLRIAYLTQIRDIDESATLEEELNRRGHQFKN